MVGDPISDRQKIIAMRLIDDGKLTMQECVDYDFFSYTTGWRVRKQWLANKQSLPPKEPGKAPGRPRLIDIDAQEFIQSRLEEQCDLTLAELQRDLKAANHGVFHISTIWWSLKRMRWSHKGMEKFAIEQDAQARLDFKARICSYRPDQLVFIDESSFDWRCSHRRFGRAPIGQRCRKAYPLTRGKRYTIIPAISLTKGVFGVGIYESPFGGDDLFYHIRNVLLPQCRPFPEPNSVIVLDNCPYHHVAIVKELVEMYGLKIEYLPAYSPDYNPIEKVFGKVKSIMKKEGPGGDIRFRVKRALSMITDKDIEGYYRYSSYLGRGRRIEEEV